MIYLQASTDGYTVIETGPRPTLNTATYIHKMYSKLLDPATPKDGELTYKAELKNTPT